MLFEEIDVMTYLMEATGICNFFDCKVFVFQKRFGMIQTGDNQIFIRWYTEVFFEFAGKVIFADTCCDGEGLKR